jgi:hypothetical protein
MCPVGEHALVQLADGLANRDHRQDSVEPAVEVIEILLQGSVLQRLAPPADRDGAQQEPPERHARLWRWSRTRRALSATCIG